MTAAKDVSKLVDQLETGQALEILLVDDRRLTANGRLMRPEIVRRLLSRRPPLTRPELDRWWHVWVGEVWLVGPPIVRFPGPDSAA